MKNIQKSAAWCIAGVVLLGLSAGASAQVPPRAPAARVPRPAQTVQAAQPNEAPQRTTATYADWVVQCETQAGPPVQKVCDMAQVSQVQVQGRQTPFSRIAVARPVKGQPIKLAVQVPVNVTFATSARIQSSETDAGISAPFARCMPSGCFADFDIKEDILKKFRAASSGGKFSFADAGGHDVSVPLSFNGFSQAFDALAKE
jgi:invasion protein IalB